MDERTLQKTGDFGKIQKHLGELMREIAGFT
jgi:hypothetical protein